MDLVGVVERRSRVGLVLRTGVVPVEDRELTRSGFFRSVRGFPSGSVLKRERVRVLRLL